MLSEETKIEILLMLFAAMYTYNDASSPSPLIEDIKKIPKNVGDVLICALLRSIFRECQRSSNKSVA